MEPNRIENGQQYHESESNRIESAAAMSRIESHRLGLMKIAHRLGSVPAGPRRSILDGHDKPTLPTTHEEARSGSTLIHGDARECCASSTLGTTGTRPASRKRRGGSCSVGTPMCETVASSRLTTPTQTPRTLVTPVSVLRVNRPRKLLKCLEVTTLTNQSCRQIKQTRIFGRLNYHDSSNVCP